MFIAHLVGVGDGCDYTIGCNSLTVVLPDRIKTMKQAIDYVLTEADDEGCDRGCIGYYGGEDRVAAITIYEIKDKHEVDVDGFYLARHDRAQKQAAAADKKSRRAQYEKLKKEFGE